MIPSIKKEFTVEKLEDFEDLVKQMRETIPEPQENDRISLEYSIDESRSVTISSLISNMETFLSGNGSFEYFQVKLIRSDSRPGYRVQIE